MIVSDYGAIAELVTHGVAADLAEAAALALKAGVDIDMMGDAYATGLPVALERGLVEMADVDAAVRRVLRLKERLGLFDDPYREAAAPGLSPARRPAHRELAREAARRSAVLLTNRGGLLPLARPARVARRRRAARGCRTTRCSGPWSAAGSAGDMVTLLDGIRAAFPTSGIAHAPGVATNSDDASGIPAALDAARDADVVILCLGEARGDERRGGEPGRCRTCRAARRSSPAPSSTSASRPSSCSPAAGRCPWPGCSSARTPCSAPGSWAPRPATPSATS